MKRWRRWERGHIKASRTGITIVALECLGDPGGAFASSRISRKPQPFGENCVSIPKAATATEAAAMFLSVNNIEVVYSHVILVLKGVSLDVPRGGIVPLLGANGPGNTTTP